MSENYSHSIAYHNNFYGLDALKVETNMGFGGKWIPICKGKEEEAVWDRATASYSAGQQSLYGLGGELGSEYCEAMSASGQNW